MFKHRKFLDGTYMTFAAVEDTGGSAEMDPKEVDATESPLAEIAKEQEHGQIGPDTDPGSQQAALDRQVENPNDQIEDKVEDVSDEEAVEEEDEYEEYELVIAEDSSLSDEDLEEIADFAEKHNLSQEDAQRLLQSRDDSYQAAVKKIDGDRLAAQTEKRNKLMNDPEFGGANFQQNLKVMAQPVQAFGDADLAALMRSDLGNEPAFARFLFKLGKAMESDGFHGNSEGANPVQEDTLKTMYPDFYK